MIGRSQKEVGRGATHHALGLPDDTILNHGGNSFLISLRSRGSNPSGSQRVVQENLIPPQQGVERLGLESGTRPGRRNSSRNGSPRGYFKTKDNPLSRCQNHRTRVLSRQPSLVNKSEKLTRGKTRHKRGRPLPRPSKNRRRGLLPRKSDR